MKKFLITLAMAMGVLSIQAQREKNLVVDANAEIRTVSAFTGIELSGAIDLYLSQGNTDAVAISAASDDMKARIRTEVKNGLLHIYFDAKGINWKTWGNNKMKAYVTFQKLEKMEASGACNVKATDPIRQNELRIEMSGASDFVGELEVNKLRITASGASNFSLSGKAENASIEASGACNVKAYELKTEQCKIDASGASNIQITVNKEMNATASGGSNIHYKGTGLIRDISSSGGATIRHKSDE
ncbi:MAG: hypothetical protein RLZZ28_2441 [Bacteroidota bacterium]|jgi:hypothetical protein